jgi:hypothetical protein
MSAGTGERGDYVVVDDPHSVDQAASDTERHAAVEWWNGSRGRSPPEDVL